jgi:nucleoid DNA-binding protein
MSASSSKDPSPKELIDSVAELICDQLSEGTSVDVSGLGTFAVEHRPSERPPDGSRTPPRDIVTFTPADTASSDQ